MCVVDVKSHPSAILGGRRGRWNVAQCGICNQITWRFIVFACHEHDAKSLKSWALAILRQSILLNVAALSSAAAAAATATATAAADDCLHALACSQPTGQHGRRVSRSKSERVVGSGRSGVGLILKSGPFVRECGVPTSQRRSFKFRFIKTLSFLAVSAFDSLAAFSILILGLLLLLRHPSSWPETGCGFVPVLSDAALPDIIDHPIPSFFPEACQAPPPPPRSSVERREIFLQIAARPQTLLSDSKACSVSQSGCNGDSTI